jgi:small subunit ribosomal protein S1
VEGFENSNPAPNQTMAELLAEMEGLGELRRGAIVRGQIMSIGEDGILVNVGHKLEGVVPTQEMRTLLPEELAALKVDDEIQACVSQTSGPEGQILLSLDMAREGQVWDKLAQHFEHGEPVIGQIVTVNRGGVLVDLQGVQGFIPLSQLASVPRKEVNSLDYLNSRIGEQVNLAVLELDPHRNRVVLSERVLLQKRRDELKEKLFQEIEEGQIRKGLITSITDFGSFVDLGGADGLIHISEMSWTPVNSAEETVKVGEEIEVYVLRVDKEAQRIALSLKRLRPGPWETVSDRYHIGQEVTGVVTNIVNFGAFARIEDGVEGLIHISELSDRPIQHPKEIVKEGATLELKIVSIEPERRRLGLSLKQTNSFTLEDFNEPDTGGDGYVK